MITPEDIFDKSNKQFLKIATALLNNEEVFPLTIPSNKALSGTNHSELKSAVVPLYQKSKAVKGHGYSIEWKQKSINGSKQSVPSKVYFETVEDFLRFLNRGQDFEDMKSSREIVLAAFPVLKDWVDQNPSVLLSNSKIWRDVLKVCAYFSTHHPPHPFFIRELPIEVHSKFIEQNVQLLKRLLDILLPPNSIHFDETDFASRYGLKKPNIYAQIRILDVDLKPVLGYDEAALTLDDAAWLKWLPENVFIIENQICYLTFPKIKNSVAIFGEGFKSRITKHIPWLNKTNIYCWFDLDSAGFEMLDLIRQHYPSAKSFLMDKATFDQHINFSVENKYRKKELSLLTHEEGLMYEHLQKNSKRLEQERIRQSYVKEQIEKSFRQNS